MWLAALGLLLSACSPVLIGEESAPLAGSAGAAQDSPVRGDLDAGRPILGTPDAGAVEPAAEPPAVALPQVRVLVEPLGCECLSLRAEGDGGVPPYRYEWSDGLAGAERQACWPLDQPVDRLAVVALDASGQRSEQATVPVPAADPGCGPSDPPPSAVALCLENPSFEGVPAVNVGLGGFDAAPWSTCMNPPSFNNTPDIGNPSIMQSAVPAPAPMDGATYVALGEGEQVSQVLCSQLSEAEPVSLELYLARQPVGTSAPEVEDVFLEIWGGQSADCSVRERLWMSPPLASGWHHYCVTMKPSVPLTQLTLRAAATMTSLSPGYLLIDALKPVDGCPP